jgi:hypothetical protein
MDRRLLKALTPVGRQRFYSEQLLAESKDSIELHPVLPKDPKELSPHLTTPTPKKRKTRLLGGGVIEIHPELPTRQYGEDVVDEALPGGISRIDYLIRIGLGDVKKINYFRTAIRSSEVAMRNATFRPYVVEVLERLLSLIFNDAQLYNRVRTLLQKDDRTRGETELPESVDDSEDSARFRRRTESTDFYPERAASL